MTQNEVLDVTEFEAGVKPKIKPVEYYPGKSHSIGRKHRRTGRQHVQEGIKEYYFGNEE